MYQAEGLLGEEKTPAGWKSSSQVQTVSGKDAPACGAWAESCTCLVLLAARFLHTAVSTGARTRAHTRTHTHTHHRQH